MTENERRDWETANEEYLSAALNWLRLRLDWYGSGGEQVSDAEQPAATEGRWFRWGATEEPAPALPKPSEYISEEDVRTARSALAGAEESDPPPAMSVLASRFGLSRFERTVLLLCTAMELDTRIAGLCARAQDDPSRPYPTFALAMAAFDEPAWEALAPDRPLRYWQMIEINQPGAQPLTTSPLRADERIVNYLKGLNYLDDRLTPLLVPFDEAGDTGLARSQHDVVDLILRYLTGEAENGRAPLIQLVGADSQSKQLVAGHAATYLGLQLYRMPAELLPSQAGELETLIRLWQRESVLLPVALYVDAHEQDLDGGGSGDVSARLNRFLARNNSLVVLDTRDVRTNVSRTGLSFDVDKPTPAEQQAAWGEALGEDAGQSPALLAGQFNLNLPTIHQVVRLVRAEASDDADEDLHRRLWAACLRRTRPRLDVLAQRIDAKATWDDIVLPDEQMTLLREIADQVGTRSRVYDAWGFRRKMNRGLGISALFAGESGTGKTMAAEVLANELELNLYRIDLSAVVSKYIGETEKNLRRLFDAAEDGGAILFFDEADALFGKRSEVKDSHDRYANIEVNYLLQRMEAFRGLAILATNMKSALDPAFVRRLRFIVNFPFPSIDDRWRIWTKVFPVETPTEGLDVDRLARLNLAGGSIHNVALNAAFLAAQASTPVTMPLLLRAARAEFRKMERPINERDFRWND